MRKNLQIGELYVVNILLLVPVTIYGLSFMVRAGMGVDYVYDVVGTGLRQTLIGEGILFMALIVWPAIELSINLAVWKKFNFKEAKMWVFISGIGLFLGLVGFIARL